MTNTLVVGMQWGDEGKGKIVDLASPAFDAVVRFQGGHNAGHTVKFADRHFSLHLIPSGIVHPGMRCVLGNGMVIHPEAFLTELERLRQAGVDADGRLFVSTRAHVVLPFAAALDQARETARGADRIGTTARGIGPTYESKTSRDGLRLGDLTSAQTPARLAVQRRRVAAELASLGAEPPPPLDELLATCAAWHQALAPFLCDTTALLHGWLDEGRSLLLEGAQGALLDLDHGTYPFVTSSSACAGGACTGTGLPPTAIHHVLGVLKAYTTRVGGGPFTSEAEPVMGERLRQQGNEFGTTTGRPRRCGWLDLVAARYARRLNGVSAIALTKLDVLDDLEEIPVCVGYRRGDRSYRDYSAEIESGDCQPELATLPGWRCDTTGVTDPARLPPQARAYVDFIAEQVGAPVVLISTGPRREETILCDHPALTQILGDRLANVLAGLRPHLA